MGRGPARRSATGGARLRPDDLVHRSGVAAKAEDGGEERLGANRFLEPEDRLAPPRLERIMNEIEERLSVDRTAVVGAFQILVHREHRERLDAASRSEHRHDAVEELPHANSWGEEAEGAKGGRSLASRCGEEVRVEDRSGAVSSGVKLDGALILRAELGEPARDVLCAAVILHGALHALFHAVPDLSASDLSCELLEGTVGEIEEVARRSELAAPADELEDRLPEASLPDEVDRINAILDPPRDHHVRHLEARCFVDEATVRPEDDAKRLISLPCLA